MNLTTLLKFELMKLLRQRSIYTASFIFLLIYGLFTYQTIPQIKEGLAEQLQLAKEWDGPITQKDISWYQAGENLFIHTEKEGEAGEFTDFLPPLQHRQIDLANFSNEGMNLLIFQLAKASFIEEERLRNRELLASLEDQTSFLYKKTTLYEQMLEQMPAIEISDTIGWEQAFQENRQFATLLLGLLLVLGITPLFIQDHIHGTLPLVLSSKHGKKRIVTIKVIAVFIYILGIVSIYSALHIIVAYFAYGLKNGDASLRSLILFTNTPFDWTLYQYFIIQFSTQLFGAISFGLCIMLIATICRSSLKTISIAGTLLLLPSILQLFQFGDHFLAVFSYQKLLQTYELYNEFKVFSFFTFPIFYHQLILILFTCIHVIGIFLLYHFYKRQAV